MPLKSFTAVRHEFDLLDIPARPLVALRRATFDDIDLTAEMVKLQLPGVTAPDHVIARVISYNRDNVLMVTRGGRIVGLCAMLMLAPPGLEALLLGEFDPLNPNPTALAATGERPAAIYHWAVIAPRGALEGIRHVSEFLRVPPFCTSNYFARPVTASGTRLVVALGFRPIVAGTPGLFRYVRIANRVTSASLASEDTSPWLQLLQAMTPIATSERTGKTIPRGP